MATQSELQARLDAIDKAIGSGELIVQFSDRRVQYRSIAELKEARSLIQVDLNVAASVPSIRQYLLRARSGLER